MTTESNAINILLVDDRPENLLALESLLEGEEIKIHKARSGREALDLMLSYDFAVSLIDVQMPEMSGFELAEFMRGTARTKNIPIVFVTAGNRSSQNVFKGYESGAVDFLYKPLDPFAVKSKVRVFVQLSRQRDLLNSRLGEVQEAITALKRTEADLQRAVEVRDEFLSIASHELKTPLTPLKLQIQGLQRLATSPKADAATLPGKVAAVAQKAGTAIGRVEALVENLLDVTRISAGQLELNPEEFDVSELAAEVTERYAEVLREAGCELKTKFEPGLRIVADRLRIEQALTNLITNAKKYAPGAEVSVSTRRRGTNACLEVFDQGPGISEDYQRRIFTRFERLKNTAAVSGLGLGLFISRQIAQAHGGDIHLESHEGQGARFSILLPLKPSEPETEPHA